MFIDKLLDELECLDVLDNTIDRSEIEHAIEHIQGDCKHRWAVLELHRSRMDAPQFCADCLKEK